MTTAVPDDFCRRIDLLRDEVRLLLRVAQGGLARRAYLRMEYGLKPKKRRFTLRKYENCPFRAKKQILGNSVFIQSTIRPIPSSDVSESQHWAFPLNPPASAGSYEWLHMRHMLPPHFSPCSTCSLFPAPLLLS